MLPINVPDPLHATVMTCSVPARGDKGVHDVLVGMTSSEMIP